MSDNKLQTQQRKSFTNYLQDQVSRALDTMPGIVSTSEARRLTLNLAIAAQESIDKARKPFEWTNSSIATFLTKVTKTVTAGLDAANDEVYVYPYGQEMAVMPSYRGYVKMAKEHGVGKKITDMLCFVIREGETFSVSYGASSDEWHYQSIAFNDAEPIGYVTVVVYEDGTSRVMEHTLEEINKRMKANPQGTSPAWKNWPVEMAKAKALKRHAKTINIKLNADVEEVLEEEIQEEPFKDVTPPTLELPQVAEPSVAVNKEEAAIPTPEPTSPPEPQAAEQAEMDLSWMEA